MQRFALILPLLVVGVACNSNESATSTPSHQKNVDSSGKHTESSTKPIEIVRAAIEACGGEPNFAKANIAQTKMTMEGALLPGMSGNFTKFDIFHLPGKHKRTVKGELNGETIDLNFVNNGDDGWMQSNGGEPKPIPVNPTQSVYPNDYLAGLLALVDWESQISLVPSEEMNGRPAYCIRLEDDGQWVSNTFYDKKTHLMIASMKQFYDVTTKKWRVASTYYSDYQMIEGLNLPMLIEVVVDGETTSKIKVTEVKFLQVVDEDLFAKPAANSR